MKKQRKRIYTALLCTCFLFSTASVPVSAAETEQEEEMTTLSSRSGEAEVSTKDELTSALGDSTKDTVKLTADIIIDTTLTVNRAVTLDLNGFVLRMTGNDSVIKVEQGGELTIADSDTDKEHKFAQNPDGLWVLIDSGGTSSKTVSGGIITDGKAQKGGGVYVAPGGKLHMTGGSIVGCQAKFGGGVYLDNNDQTGEPSEFTMMALRFAAVLHETAAVCTLTPAGKMETVYLPCVTVLSFRVWLIRQNIRALGVAAFTTKAALSWRTVQSKAALP